MFDITVTTKEKLSKEDKDFMIMIIRDRLGTVNGRNVYNIKFKKGLINIKSEDVKCLN